MHYDSLTLACCLKEIRAALGSCIVHQVRQPSETDIVLVCRRPGHQVSLLMSADPRWARAHLTYQRHNVPATPPGFCQLARKHLEGRRIESIQQVGLDRVWRMTFVRAGQEPVGLIHEIMGRHSNIVLTSETDTVLGAAKLVGQKVSRARQILPGRDYVLPPTQKLDFRELESGKLAEMLDGASNVQDWLVRTFAGVGPLLARELVHRAGSEHPEDLQEQLRWLGELIESGEYNPVVASPAGVPAFAYPIRLKHLPESVQSPRGDICTALESTVTSEMGSADTEAARLGLLRSLERSQKHWTETASELESVLADPEAPERLRRRADNLSAQFGKIEPGSAEVELDDMYETGARVTIALRPELPPHENLERAYKAARKAEDRIASAQERLPVVRGRLAAIAVARASAEAAATAEQMEAIRRDAEKEGLLRAEREPGAPQAAAAFGGARIRTITSAEGFEILVGETAEANDYLTTRVAGPNDIWMHARAVTGAHVVIRTGGRVVPKATLEKAASEAARNSQAKHSSYVPVDWTLRKHVRKPRKGAPGLVTYTHEKTLHIVR